MSDVERIFDRFIDAFADDLLEIARAHIDVEVGRALAVAERSNSKQTKAQLRAQKKAQRLKAKAQLKLEQRRKREEKRAARLAEKERIKAERLAEKATRQLEHDRLKQQRLALKQELEAERRRLREATRKRPARQQLPLDFDGLRTPKPRRGAPAVNSPPQLFVHKRKRDGQIEKLARNDAPGTDGAAGASGGAVTNGAAVSNGAATEVPAPPPAQ
jgi:multidrug efflux pump subunit AcrA (membrane-fusion protein)